MSFENPTGVRLGQSGVLAGRRYTVVGRVVMGMEDEGETYYWNEFNLTDDQGGFATLVFEEGENGPGWKLFTLFDPVRPISAAEAREKKQGETINLHGSALPITLVDESRVYFIEGQAPEGVEVGDIAQYFNAERGQWMLVVSWTGDEVEVFRGMILPPGAVEKAFGISSFLPGFGLRQPPSDSIGRDDSSGGIIATFKAVFTLALIGVVLLGAIPQFRRQATRNRTVEESPANSQPPPAFIQLGQKVNLEGRDLQVNSRFGMEIQRMGANFHRYEYGLADEENRSILLIKNLRTTHDDWALFSICQSPPLSQSHAAALKWGEEIEIDGVKARVIQMFRLTIREQASADPGSHLGKRMFGFLAEEGTNLFLARWNQESITWHRGGLIPEPKVLPAFQ